MTPPIGSRYAFEETPEGRLAAIAQDVRAEAWNLYKHEPDFADFRDAFRPELAKETLRVRIAESRACGRADRARELERELASLEKPERPRR